MINEEKEKEIVSLLEDQKNNKLFMEVTGYISRLDGYIYKLEKENEQLKYQLEYEKENLKFSKDYSKSLEQKVEQLKEHLTATSKGLKKTALKRKKWKTKYQTIKHQLKQRDEVIDRTIKMLEINIELVKEQPSNDKLADKFIIERYNNLLEILKNTKGDNK